MPATDNTPVIIVEPSGRQWPLTLDNRYAIRRLLPGIAKQLYLPRDLNYELIEIATERTLDPNRSCSDQGIRPYTSLKLVPVFDQKLSDAVRLLREEAETLRRHGLPEQANGRLADIQRLDPAYVDFGLPELRSMSSTSRGIYSEGPYVTIPETPSTWVGRSDSGRDYTGTIIVMVIIVFAVVAWIILSATNDGSTEAAGLGSLPQPIETPLASVIRTGDLKVSLTWDAAADLDLHVIDPFGVEVWSGNPVILSGGRLSGRDPRRCRNEPGVVQEELIVWDGEGAPAGNYTISVVYANSCGATGPVAYNVRVESGGVELGVAPGVLNWPGATSGGSSLTREPPAQP